MDIPEHFSILPSKHFKMSPCWTDCLTFSSILFFPPTTFNLALIQCIISYIIYSKSNEACCSDIPFLALMLLNTLQTNRNCDENTMLSCNAVGGSDFSASSNKTKHDLFIAINIMSSLLLEEFLSITAPSCIIVLWSLGLSVTHCFRPLHQNHIY